VPLITLTRGSLSASRAVAETLGRELGFSIVTREQIIEHARQYGVDETGLAEKDLMAKQPPQVWDRHAAQRRLYLILLRASLLDLIADGNAVYMGHMGQFVLSDVPKVLRIRVDSSLEYRVGALMKGSKLSENEARDYIETIDQRRRSWAKFLYGVDYDDPLHYDIILNLERLSLASAGEIVSCAVKRKEWQLDGESMQTIQDVRLAAVVLARLARSPRTRGMELAVDADSRSGDVKIRGMSTLVGARTWQDDIKEVVKGMKGINAVEVIDLR
jgi:cytidylate kinase